MKSFIEFSEEVIAPMSSPPTKSLTCQEHFDTAGLLHRKRDSDFTESTTNTETDSESDDIDSVSDFDESSISSSYHDSSVSDGNDEAATDFADTKNTQQSQRTERSVSFGPIHVRQYERIVGDHPDTRVGVPLALGWAYFEDDRYPDGIPIFRYESDRIRRGKTRMSSITRKNLLLNVHKLPAEEILEAEKQSKRNRKLREKARLQQQGVTQTQNTLRKIGKKIRKGGVSVLMGMSFAAQVGVGGGGLTAAADYTF